MHAWMSFTKENIQFEKKMNLKTDNTFDKDVVYRKKSQCKLLWEYHNIEIIIVFNRSHQILFILIKICMPYLVAKSVFFRKLQFDINFISLFSTCTSSKSNMYNL